MEIKYIERPFEVKAVQENGVFEGFGSIFGNVDLDNDIVAPGAFTESLAQWKASGRLPPILWQHRSGEPIGPYLEMQEQAAGLWVKGQLLVDDVQRAREARALMKAKAVNGLSIGYAVREDSYDRVTGVRTLKKVDLWEVSIVTFPANPSAQISSVKSAIDAIQTVREAEEFLRDAGLSKAQAAAFIGRFKSLSGQRESGDELGDLVASIVKFTEPTTNS
ncbi:HK97 family phage prohead protease [Massilia agilis]|uniref:HK97 family phage prohead protease n=1 Tax=Massilia agilis TaxID=1811226 RepID=A0ABT2DBI3_9BURK|nr:HK97 family phage prohead protease [Massilia agilis]MCS0808680.1 HK97 family phage prohead protease [Massilia agilis]